MTRADPQLVATPTAMLPQAPDPSQLPIGGPTARPADAAKPTGRSLPLLRLEVRDLSSDGAKAFLSHVDCTSLLSTAVRESLSLLYPDASTVRPVRSVTLVLRAFAGIAHTLGTELDDEHKEIHLSTDYVAAVAGTHRVRDEVVGVVCHEMVHCWQWDARGTCPGGLIEGVADYVRLKCGHGPPGWKRGWKDCSWDAGYEKTAYFLEWLECRLGPGTVVRMNEQLRDRVYEEKLFWEHCCGSDVNTLWKQYCDDCDGKFGAGLDVL